MQRSVNCYLHVLHSHLLAFSVLFASLLFLFVSSSLYTALRYCCAPCLALYSTPYNLRCSPFRQVWPITLLHSEQSFSPLFFVSLSLSVPCVCSPLPHHGPWWRWWRCWAGCWPWCGPWWRPWAGHEVQRLQGDQPRIQARG